MGFYSSLKVILSWRLQGSKNLIENYKSKSKPISEDQNQTLSQIYTLRCRRLIYNYTRWFGHQLYSLSSGTYRDRTGSGNRSDFYKSVAPSMHSSARQIVLKWKWLAFIVTFLTARFSRLGAGFMLLPVQQFNIGYLRGILVSTAQQSLWKPLISQ